MNNIVPVSRLSQIFANECGIDIETATAFVKEYFSTIESALASGDNVVINELGTFELTSDPQNPVNFIPSESLAKKVNAPFEFFTAIPLEDGEEVDIPSVSRDKVLVQEPVDETDDEDVPEEVTVEYKELPDDNIVRPDEIPTPVPDVEDKTVEKDIEQQYRKQAPVSKSVQMEHDEPVPDSKSQEDRNEQRVVTVQPDENAQWVVKYDGGSRSFLTFWFVIVFIIGILVGIACGYFGHSAIYKAITGHDYDMPVTSSVIVEDTVAVRNIEESPADTAKEKTLSAVAGTVKENPVAVESKPGAEVKAPRYDVITKNVFLTTLARKYYGEMDYWVYIYEANNLGNPNRISPGTRVRIPYPEDLNLTGNRDKDISNARSKAAVVYSRYK